MKETIEHSCPNCGASMRFDIGTQSVVCEYCGTSYDPRSLLVDDTPIESDPGSIGLSEDAGEEWSAEEMDSLDSYACGSCGSSLYTDRTTSATICPYCGNAVILKGRIQGSLRPDRVIPFKFDKEKALEALDQHYSKRRFVPKAFKETNQLDEVKGLYVPYWIYSADIHADMTFTAIKERTVVSGKNEDLKERKYYRVRKEGDISFDHVPADASSKMPDDLMESLEPFDLSESDSFRTDYLAGYVADKYDVPQEDVLPRIRERMSKSVEDSFKGKIEGYDEIILNNAEVETVRSDADYVLFPVWLFNLSWEDRKYTFAMNGQTGKVVGDIPMDKTRLNICIIALYIFLIAGAWFTFSAEFRGEELMDWMSFVVFIWAGVCLGIRQYFVSQLKSVEFREDTDDYYREGSLVITGGEEEFLYRKLEFDD